MSSLGEVYIMCPALTACMPGGVIVGDSGLCCCAPVQCVTSIVRAQFSSLCLFIMPYNII